MLRLVVSPTYGVLPAVAVLFLAAAAACSSTNIVTTNEGGAGPAQPDGGADAEPPPPSYFVTVLPETTTRVGTDDVGAAFLASSLDDTGRLGILFADQKPPARDRYHVRYVTREGDASAVSATFDGGQVLGDVTMAFHPSGEMTICSIEESGTNDIRIVRLDKNGRVTRDFRLGNLMPAAQYRGAGICQILPDDEDALVMTGVISNSGPLTVRLDRVPREGAPTLLTAANPCLERSATSERLGSMWSWARSKAGTIWTNGGCELDPKTGKTLTDKAIPSGSVLTVDTTARGDTYLIQGDTRTSPTVAVALPSLTETSLLLEDPFTDTQMDLRSRFLFTDQGWTMVEGELRTANIAFWHSPSLGGPASRLEFAGPFTTIGSQLGSNGDYWLVGGLYKTASFGVTPLTHHGSADATNHLVARFRDWPSIVAAHGQ